MQSRNEIESNALPQIEQTYADWLISRMRDNSVIGPITKPIRLSDRNFRLYRAQHEKETKPEYKKQKSVTHPIQLFYPTKRQTNWYDTNIGELRPI